MWQALPPELTTYIRGGANRVRELDFRGLELETAYFAVNPNYQSPRIQIRSAIPNPSQLQRWIPGPNIYVDIPAVNGVVNGNFLAFGIRIAVTLANAAVIPTAPSGVGEAIMAVWQDFESQYGDGNDLLPCASLVEPTTGGIRAVSFSGGSLSSGQNFILPNPGFSSEFGWTWLFEQSMIQQVTQSQLISSSGQILGGGAPPAPFTVQQNDGRGAIYPLPGDAISYSGNSTYGNPQPGGVPTNTWFVPFVLFSGDVPPLSPLDPTPETWSDGTVAYIYGQKVADWIDDFCAVTGACPPGTGAIIDPLANNWALWMGIDLPNFINVTVLLNGLSFADTSSGFQWAGPVVMMFDASVNPVGPIGRNIANHGGFILDQNGNAAPNIREYRTLLTAPQSGWTPVAVGPTPFLGFGTHPGGPTVSGQTFAVQCWMLDLNITQMVDMTNVSVSNLQ
jgi:hypothetical protein